MAEAPIVLRNPIVYFTLETPTGFLSSEWKISNAAEIVNRTKEFTMKGVNFWELRKKEKKALKANWVAQRRE